MGLRAVSPDSRDMNAGRKRLARGRAKSALTSGKLPASSTLVACGPGSVTILPIWVPLYLTRDNQTQLCARRYRYRFSPLSYLTRLPLDLLFWSCRLNTSTELHAETVRSLADVTSVIRLINFYTQTSSNRAYGTNYVAKFNRWPEWRMLLAAIWSSRHSPR